jgi:hypothetical protein
LALSPNPAAPHSLPGFMTLKGRAALDEMKDEF